MKKIVVKLGFQDEKIKKKPMQAISSIGGVVSMSMEGDKITVIGDVDPVLVVKKLEKWVPQLNTVGPAKEEKKDDKKPAEGDKKPAGGDDKDAAAKKKAAEEEAKRLAYYQHMYQNANYYYAQPQYVHSYAQPHYVHNYNDNPNSCVIC